jgi:hypothetical protein
LDEAKEYFSPLILQWAEAADELPAWWSPERDVQIRRIWKRDGLMASTIYTMQAILSTIGWTMSGQDDAVKISKEPFETAEFGQGLKTLTKKLAEDWFTQDNGIMVELLGEEGDDNVSEPLLLPRSLCHLDAGRCWRSGDSQYPIWYLDKSPGVYKWIKYHWTRVAFSAPNPSAIEEARGIGLCAVSRMAILSRMMRDTIRYKSEKVGGRQTRAIMTISGAPKSAVELAMEEAEESANNANQIRFSAIPVIAAPGLGARIEADLLEFARVPDGFKWEDEIQMYMYTLALAFGIDARELWPSTQSGATKADAEVQHRKAMRKGVGDFISTLEWIWNNRVTVGGAIFEYKPKDYDEERAQADVDKIHVEAAASMSKQQFITPRGGTVYLVNKGVLPREYLDNPDLSTPDATPSTEDAPQTVSSTTSETAERVRTANTEPVSSDEMGRADDSIKQASLAGAA